MARNTNEARNRTKLRAAEQPAATRKRAENGRGEPREDDGHQHGRGKNTDHAGSESRQQGGGEKHGDEQNPDPAPGSRTTANNTTEGRKRAQHRARRQRPSTRRRAETGPSRI